MSKRPSPKSERDAERQEVRAAQLKRMGEKIDAAATRANVTTTAIAKEAGVTFAAASRWRKGKAMPEGEHLLAIARACRVSPDEFEGLLDATEPQWPAWRELLALEGARLNADEKKRIARSVRLMLKDGEVPELPTLQLAAAAVRSLRRS
jgi:transcriptional regulator with XRE-family HTH domain